MEKQKIAIIIPLYNPPDLWEENCAEHILSVIKLYPQYVFCFIFVNDGSKKIVNKRIVILCKKFSIKYKALSLKTHIGKGMALKTGVDSIKTDYYFCVDWDFPFGVNILQNLLWQLNKGVDVVIIGRGKKYLTQLPIFRSLLTKMWRFFINYVLKLKVVDTQSGLKGFNNKGKGFF